MSWQRVSRDVTETTDAGESLARVLRPGDVLLLSGQLGSGKTVLAQGLARGLGVKDRVTSPTFVIVREHECENDLGITTLHHCDVYRVQSIDEVADLALGELVEESAVAIIEWGEIAASLFGRDVLEVELRADGENTRTLRVSGALCAGREAALDAWSLP